MKISAGNEESRRKSWTDVLLLGRSSRVAWPAQNVDRLPRPPFLRCTCAHERANVRRAHVEKTRGSRTQKRPRPSHSSVERKEVTRAGKVARCRPFPPVPRTLFTRIMGVVNASCSPQAPLSSTPLFVACTFCVLIARSSA
jgi:hypothetical protein